MDGVKLDLGLLHLDGHLNLVEGVCHRLQLTNGVGGEAAPLGPVMQHETLGSLVIHEVRRSSDSWIGELEILVEVIKTIEEVSQFSAKQRQHISISEKVGFK